MVSRCNGLALSTHPGSFKPESCDHNELNKVQILVENNKPV